MLKRVSKNKCSGQTMIEYTVVIGVVSMVLFAMNPMLKRSTQGMIKSMADQIGTQQNAEQDFSADSSHLVYSYTTTRAQIEKRKLESAGGIINYVFNDMVNMEVTSYTNMGFTPEN